MRKASISLAVVVGLAVLASAGMVWAQAEKAISVEVTGKLVVTKASDGAVTKAVLSTPDGKVLTIQLDVNGKKLVGTPAPGKLVKVVGVVNADNVITVEKFDFVAADEPEMLE